MFVLAVHFLSLYHYYIFELLAVSLQTTTVTICLSKHLRYFSNRKDERLVACHYSKPLPRLGTSRTHAPHGEFLNSPAHFCDLHCVACGSLSRLLPYVAVGRVHRLLADFAGRD